MEVTQAVLKYSDIYGVTFNDKYSDIKTIATKNGFNCQSDGEASTLIDLR